MADTHTTTSGAASENAVAAVSLFKKRGAKGKANLRKRPATPAAAAGDSDNSSCTSSEDESGHRVKRRKRTAAVTASSENNAASGPEPAATFEADRSATITSTNDATKRSDWYEDDKHLLGKTRPLPQDRARGPDGTYRGIANQATFIQKNPDAPDRRVGPVKAPTNIRTITVTDFAPDVCKDYKQTGFCGFGDNCKFLHAREVYQQGWQLDRDWENVSKGKSMGGTVVASANRDGKPAADDADAADEALLEKIPFACVICKGPYRSPIVTKCGHYFCEPCALDRYRRDPSCAACGCGTNGIFNMAKTLSKLLVKKQERAAKRRQKAIDAGEEVPDEDQPTIR